MNEAQKKPRRATRARTETTGGVSTVNQNFSTNGRPVPVYRQDGRAVGHIEGDTLIKTAQASVHMLKRPPAWGWDAEILETAEQQGARYTTITDSESGKIYRATLADFWRHGLSIDRGHGRQVMLPLCFWQVTRPGELAAVQLDLFGGIT